MTDVVRVAPRPVPAARLLEVDAVVGRETAPARVPRVEAASTQHLVVGGRAAVHRPNFWPKGLCGAPRRSRGAPFAFDRLRGLPRGRDGAGAAGGGVRAPCDTAPKMSALRCYPLLSLFSSATWQSLPSNASRDLAPPRPRRGRPVLPDARLAANRHLVHVVTRMSTKAGYFEWRGDATTH